jgi:hypothetical protein
MDQELVAMLLGRIDRPICKAERMLAAERELGRRPRSSAKNAPLPMPDRHRFRVFRRRNGVKIGCLAPPVALR